MGHPAIRGFKKSGNIEVELEIHTRVNSHLAEVDLVLSLFGTTNHESFRCSCDNESERYRLIKELHDAGDDLSSEETLEALKKIKEAS